MSKINFVSLKLCMFHLILTGIPVWIGRKLHTRYRLSGKHKRNFAVLGGVAASVSIFFIKKFLFSKHIGINSHIYNIYITSQCRLKKRLSMSILLLEFEMILSETKITKETRIFVYSTFIAVRFISYTENKCVQ